MADTYTVNIEALINLAGVNIEIDTPQATGTPVYSAQLFTLQSGNNSFTVPTGAKFLIIIPDGGNLNTYKLKGNNADTGVDVMGDYKPMLLNVKSAGTIIITSSGTDTLPTKFIWF